MHDRATHSRARTFTSGGPIRTAPRPRPLYGGSGAHLLDLQAAAGNRAVSALVAQREASDDAPTAGPVEGAHSGVSDAPAATHMIPFDRAPLAAPGERVIFNSVFTDPSPSSYQLEYSATGGNFTSASGPTSRTIAGLTSGNVDFFIPTPWIGTPPVQVVMILRKISDSSVVRTETWNFGLKTRIPTTMTQREGVGERTLPGVYTYDIGPAIIPMMPPYYQHQTILEQFSTWTLANIVPADIKPAYAATHSLTSVPAITAHFLGPYAGSNGTFTVNANDRIADRHGGHPNLSNLVANLVTPKDIEVALPQTYEATPGTTLGSYTVTRVLKADGTTWMVKKG
jgi:hypothetical protein